MPVTSLVARYDHILLDLDGCVWVGDQPTPRATEAVTALLERNTDLLAEFNVKLGEQCVPGDGSDTNFGYAMIVDNGAATQTASNLLATAITSLLTPDHVYTVAAIPRPSSAANLTPTS